MGLQTIQSCEQCGEKRQLNQKENPDTGGWRTLNSGNQSATFCNHCVRALVTKARDAATARIASEDGS